MYDRRILVSATHDLLGFVYNELCYLSYNPGKLCFSIDPSSEFRCEDVLVMLRILGTKNGGSDGLAKM